MKNLVIGLLISAICMISCSYGRTNNVATEDSVYNDTVDTTLIDTINLTSK